MRSFLSSLRLTAERFLRPTHAGSTIACLLILLVSVGAWAQITPVEEKGLPPNSVFSGGDVDVVNLQNGNLHISIPIASVAQRGGGKLEYQFVYDTQAWMKQYVANNCPNPQACNPPGYYVAQVNPNVSSGWRLTSPLDWSVGFTESGLINCPSTNLQYQQETNWVVEDPQGTQHALPLRYEIATNSCLGNTTKGPTLDGSGMVYDEQANILYMKNGEQKNVSNQNKYLLQQNDNVAFISRDKNGNTITSTGDTLNRGFLTVFNGTTSGGLPYTTYTAQNYAGNPLVFRVDYQQVAVQTDICAATTGGPGGAATNCTDYSTTETLPSQLTLPTGKTYIFKYAPNTPGDLQELDLPTGATITYSYEDFYIPSPYQHGTEPNYVGSRAVTKRVETIGSRVNTWTYTPSIVADSVTDPIGNVQVHQFNPVSTNAGSLYYTTTSVYETGVLYYDSSGNLLRTVSKTYTGEPDLVNNAVANVRVISTTTTLENGQTSQTQTDFETFQYPCVDAGGACTGTATRLNPTETREYDYGTNAPGALLRRTDYTYLHTGNQSYIDLNIVDKPTSITVYDGNGNQAAETINEYDNYSHTGQLMESSNAIQHDSGYGTGFTTRGNLTGVEKWRNTDGALLTTTNQYDDAGNILSTIDPGGHETSYSFVDSWAGSACVPTGATAAFQTVVTNAKGQSASTTYYACNGLVGSTTDANSNTTTNSYDSFDRPLTIQFPQGGGSKTFCYSDDPNGACYNAGSLYSTETDAISGTTSKLTTTLYDALGRVQESQLNSDPGGTDYVDTFYDGDGRPYQKTNPYRSGDTQYTTTTYYDGIGRVSSVSEADGSSTYTTYSGNTTTITDEAGHQRKSQSDALGRLTYVWEDPAGLNYETDYQYDVLGNLLQVTQKGGDSNSADWRVRSFTFNSLSQLLCSANPEIGSPLAAVASCPTTDNGSYIAGTTRYNYNNDDELTSKIAPLPNQQGTSTVTITYAYDVLHRPTGITYTDSTPGVAYIYDNDPISGCTVPTLTTANMVGHMEAMCDASGATAWSYDTMGRTTTEARTIAGIANQIGYLYYLDGTVKTITYPLAGGTTPFVITYHENAAGRVDSATGSDGVTYAQVNSTFASGLPNVSQLGSNIQLTDTYNARLQPLSTTAEQISTTNTLFSRTYNFNAGTTDNGNLYGVQDGLDGLGLNRPNGSVNYGYDNLNRIISAATTGTDCTMMSGGTHDWASSYTVDPWGNLTAKTSTLCQGEAMSASTSNNRNQLSLATYDSAGNLTQENGVGYTYDAEGRLINGSGTAYTYDGLGERVIKGGSKLYWKGVGSTALVETDQSGASLSRYIFFNGQRIAREDANPGCGNGFTPPRYYVTDNVGSTSLVTDSIGDVLNESLFFPYGVERIISQNDTGNNYKFSGKERDPETGLDDFGARYYDSALGRFMTPDWDGKPITVPYAKLGDPQTLNLYSYVENGPLNRVDADGHAWANTSLEEISQTSCSATGYSGGTGCYDVDPQAVMAVNSGADKATFEANTEATAKQAAASTGNNAGSDEQSDASVKERAAQGAEAALNMKIAQMKFGAAAELSETVETGAGAVAVGYIAVSGTGNAMAAGFQLLGAATGQTQASETAAEVTSVATSAYGLTTLVATGGNMHRATQAAAVEGILSSNPKDLVTGGTPSRIAAATDFVHSVATFKNQIKSFVTTSLPVLRSLPIY